MPKNSENIKKSWYQLTINMLSMYFYYTDK